jgi:hypothetical protein
LTKQVKKTLSAITAQPQTEGTIKKAETVPMMTEKRCACGRPLKIKTVKALEEAIVRYFDETGKPVLNREGETVAWEPGPYTMAGLARAIGISRASLLRYEYRPQFRDAVQRAKARVEEYAESKLFDHGLASGAKFALANNFELWREQAAPAGINLMIGSVEEAQKFLTGMAGLFDVVEKNVTPGLTPPAGGQG